MLRELFEQQQKHINDFFNQIDIQHAERFLEILMSCRGVLIFTGVGKSAMVANKISVTLTSTGSRSLFLSIVDALHGDIGIITDQDVVVMISKSGESDELLQLVPFIRNKGARVLSIVQQKNSRLEKICNDTIVLPLAKEVCPFDTVPTTSAVTQLIFGDILAIALMKKKNFSMEQYALNHPSGRIGRRLTFKVKDLMLTGDQIPTCDSNDKLGDTLVELSNKKCGCILILDKERKLQGIFTDGDLRRSLQKHGSQALDHSMSLLMNSSPRFITEETMAIDAMQQMEQDPQRPITVLPVISKDQQILGIIKMHDIVQAGL